MDSYFPMKDIFARASKGSRRKGNACINYQDKNASIEGAKIFKRRVLGICGTYSMMPLDELVDILCSMGVVSSLEEGKKFVPRLYGFRLDYGEGILNFIEVKRDNKKACLITRDNYSYRAYISEIEM